MLKFVHVVLDKKLLKYCLYISIDDLPALAP